jgi:O-Antigen ligase
MSRAALDYQETNPAAVGTGQKAVANRVWIASFVIATATPLIFQISGAHLNAHRIMMLVMIVPLVIGWISGRAPGKVLLVDILMLLNVLWMLLALAANHPPGQIFVFWLSQAVETLGPYLLARLVIRDRESFFFFVKALAAIVICILPFAMIESLTGRTILADIFEKIPGTGVPANVGYGERLGLVRAQTTFEHPILYGAYCAIPLSLTLVCLKADSAVSTMGRWIRAIGITAAVFFSLSSGALAAVVVQVWLLAWDYSFRTMKARWHLFSGLFAMGYAFVSVVSNRAPLVVLISYVTFSASTAYNRVLIWRYGTDDVMDNPLFGIGLNDWSRPFWMVSSVDNFWLLWAMRYGLVGFALLAVSILLILRGAIRRDFSADAGLADCRKGYVFAIIGLSTALATVAFWGGAYAMLCFLIGGGVWMLTAEPGQSGKAEIAPLETSAAPSRYTRFASSREVTASARGFRERPDRRRRAGS